MSDDFARIVTEQYRRAWAGLARRHAGDKLERVRNGYLARLRTGASGSAVSAVGAELAAEGGIAAGGLDFGGVDGVVRWNRFCWEKPQQARDLILLAISNPGGGSGRGQTDADRPTEVG